MKRQFIFLLLITIMVSSCARTKKSQKEPVLQVTNIEQKEEPKPVQNNDNPPITEKEEKIVTQADAPKDPHHYFVIIGSFKIPDNARRFQEQIASDGFTSILLKNSEGYYRVSVKSTDDITAAREEIRRIRTHYDKYDDTWLLISVR
jgi:cell division protein FtsN